MAGSLLGAMAAHSALRLASTASRRAGSDSACQAMRDPAHRRRLHASHAHDLLGRCIHPLGSARSTKGGSRRQVEMRPRCARRRSSARGRRTATSNRSLAPPTKGRRPRRPDRARRRGVLGGGRRRRMRAELAGMHGKECTRADRARRRACGACHHRGCATAAWRTCRASCATILRPPSLDAIRRAAARRANAPSATRSGPACGRCRTESGNGWIRWSQTVQCRRALSNGRTRGGNEGAMSGRPAGAGGVGGSSARTPARAGCAGS